MLANRLNHQLRAVRREPGLGQDQLRLFGGLGEAPGRDLDIVQKTGRVQHVVVVLLSLADLARQVVHPVGVLETGRQPPRGQVLDILNNQLAHAAKCTAIRA